jgi:hypothetical protein
MSAYATAYLWGPPLARFRGQYAPWGGVTRKNHLTRVTRRYAT